jgi:hypothetical protein
MAWWVGKVTRLFTRRRAFRRELSISLQRLEDFSFEPLEKKEDMMNYIEVANKKSLEAFIEEYLPER